MWGKLQQGMTSSDEKTSPIWIKNISDKVGTCRKTWPY
jgi:hypothetical protein